MNNKQTNALNHGSIKITDDLMMSKTMISLNKTGEILLTESLNAKLTCCPFEIRFQMKKHSTLPFIFHKDPP